MADRLYANLAELEHDLNYDQGVRDVSRALERIRAASDWIDQNIGIFIPKTEARRFDGPARDNQNLIVENLLAETEVKDDTDVLLTTDYLLYPRQRLWENGPYHRIQLDPDAVTISGFSPEDDIIVVTGRWGLYEETVDVGTDLNDASHTDSKTALIVDDGSKISPGMVLRIGTEQFLVEDIGALTAAITTTNEALDASEEEVTVVDGSLVNVGEIIRVNFEKMRILDISTNDLLVARGYLHTKKVTHTTGANVDVHRTFTVKRGVNGTTAAAQADNADINRYLPPWQVNWLCRQMGGLMEKKAATGFAGKTANVELGEVFYHDEFPEKVIDEIKQNYMVPIL